MSALSSPEQEIQRRRFQSRPRQGNPSRSTLAICVEESVTGWGGRAKAVSCKTKVALQRIYGEVEIAEKSKGYKHATYDGDRLRPLQEIGFRPL